MAGAALFPTLFTADTPECEACQLYQQCSHPKITPSGDGDGNILFVGEAPGAQEDASGKVFVGRAGQRLRQAVEAVGYELNDHTITNTIICRPPENKMRPEYAAWCRPALLKTIRKVKPNVIVPLGSFAFQAAMQDIHAHFTGGVDKWRGFVIPSLEWNAWVCPTYHPSYVLRSEKDEVLGVLFESDLRAACRMEAVPFDGFETLANLKSRVELVVKPSAAVARLKDLAGRSGVLVFDYETNALKPEGPDRRILSCSFCLDGDDTWACLVDDSVLQALSPVLRNPKLRKVASNLKFEERWTLAALGHGVEGWAWDTMLAAHILDNRGGISSVKFQALIHLGLWGWEVPMKPYLDKGRDLNRLAHMPLPELLLYNGLDSLIEYRVMEAQRKQMGRRSRER